MQHHSIVHLATLLVQYIPQKRFNQLVWCHFVLPMKETDCKGQRQLHWKDPGILLAEFYLLPPILLFHTQAEVLGHTQFPHLHNSGKKASPKTWICIPGNTWCINATFINKDNRQSGLHNTGIFELFNHIMNDVDTMQSQHLRSRILMCYHMCYLSWLGWYLFLICYHMCYLSWLGSLLDLLPNVLPLLTGMVSLLDLLPNVLPLLTGISSWSVTICATSLDWDLFLICYQMCYLSWLGWYLFLICYQMCYLSWLGSLLDLLPNVLPLLTGISSWSVTKCATSLDWDGISSWSVTKCATSLDWDVSLLDVLPYVLPLLTGMVSLLEVPLWKEYHHRCSQDPPLDQTVFHHQMTNGSRLLCNSHHFFSDGLSEVWRSSEKASDSSRSNDTK